MTQTMKRGRPSPVQFELAGHLVAEQLILRTNKSRLGERRLLILEGVKVRARKVAIETFKTLDAWGVVKDVTVVVVPAPCIQGPDGTVAFAVTVRRKNKTGIGIMVSGGRPDDMTARDFLTDLLPTSMAHEWAHAEQWQTRGLWQERGINVRARTLLKGPPAMKT